MAMQVLASTDDVPALAEVVKHRRATGLDRYDEWWDGVYRIMPDPTVAHQQLLMRLSVAWFETARERGLSLMQGGNIGIHEVDVRCPDITVFRQDGARTSPAHLATAELVVEALSPGEVSGAKLDFYAKWNVNEYLEIDQRTSSVLLLANHAGVWEPIEVSEVLGFTVTDVGRLLVELDEA